MKTPCSLCGSSTEVTASGDGHLCQPCADKNRVGRDSTTRKVKLMQTALRGKAEASHRAGAGGEPSGLLDKPVYRPLMGACGQVLPRILHGYVIRWRRPASSIFDDMRKAR